MRNALVELLLLAGLVVFGYGLWLVWLPLAVLFAGMVLLLMGHQMHRPKGK